LVGSLLFVQAGSFAHAEVVAADQSAELEALRQRVKVLEERIGSPDGSLLPQPQGADTKPASQDLFSIQGDARYRAESIAVDDVYNDRQRVRARVGIEAQVSETMRTAFRLSTGEGDPRSGHLTFSGGYSRRTVGVDLAYLQWQAISGLRVSAGKFAYPNWQPAQSVFIGGDFNPEGWATSYRSESGWFGNAHSFWLETRNDAADSMQSGVQLGFASPPGGAVQVTVAGNYTDFDNVSGRKPFLDGVNAYGNTLDADGALSNDFNVSELSAELLLRGYVGSITFFTHAAENSAVTENNAAYAAGFSFGADALRNWRFGYQYARIEKDALFGQLMDGDFGGGSTDSRGHAFRLGYRPAGRWSTTLSYLHNSIGISSPTPRAFDLIQLDIDFTY
jgi:hypothetical protein